MAFAGAKNRTGDKGTDGRNGLDGSIWIAEVGIPKNSIGKDNDFYLDINSSDVYIKENSKWIFKTNIKGADGKKGKDGTNGKDGKIQRRGTDNFGLGNQQCVGILSLISTFRCGFVDQIDDRCDYIVDLGKLPIKGVPNYYNLGEAECLV
jgi:hypothetical protein